MKKLIVIGAYPNTPKKEEIVKSEIESLQGFGFDFLLVTHYPASTELQSMVDYYIFDKNQTLTPLDKTTYYWFQTDYFLLRVNNSRHALPICQNMSNAFKMAESMGYDFVFFVENDNIFSKEDAKKLNELVENAVTNNKTAIFFKPHNYQDNYSKVYETQMFGIQPKKFNRIFKIPTTEQEFFTHSEYPISLELGFYNSLNSFESDFTIIDFHSYDYFNTSKINIFRVEHFLVDLLYNSKDEERPVLYVQNRNHEGNCRIIIKLNDEVINDRDISSGVWFYNFFEYNNNQLKVEVYIDNTLEIYKEYNLDLNLKDKIKDNGIIDLF